MVTLKDFIKILESIFKKKETPKKTEPVKETPKPAPKQEDNIKTTPVIEEESKLVDPVHVTEPVKEIPEDIPWVSPFEYFKKILPISIAFEGTGYTGVTGNFDGALLTFGIIGFNIQTGSGIQLLNTLFRTYPEISKPLINIMGWNRAWTGDKWRSWAESVTVSGKATVNSNVKTALQNLLNTKEARDLQNTIAWEGYGKRALQDFSTSGMTDLRGLAICLDSAIQQGSLRTGVGVYQKTKSLEAVAIHMSQICNPKWSADVLSRRMCIVNGKGLVHGKNFNLEKEFKIDLNEFLEIDYGGQDVLEPLPSRVNLKE